jgi:hypothetical protein
VFWYRFSRRTRPADLTLCAFAVGGRVSQLLRRRATDLQATACRNAASVVCLNTLNSAVSAPSANHLPRCGCASADQEVKARPARLWVGPAAGGMWAPGLSHFEGTVPGLCRRKTSVHHHNLRPATSTQVGRTELVQQTLIAKLGGASLPGSVVLVAPSPRPATITGQLACGAAFLLRKRCREQPPANGRLRRGSSVKPATESPSDI